MIFQFLVVKIFFASRILWNFQNKMSKNYKTVAGSKVKFVLKIEEGDLKKARKSVVERFCREVAIKGFRKGHAPESAVISQVGAERISYEALNFSIDRKYRAFVRENSISPVGNPKVDLDSVEKMPIEVRVEVEVFPEVSVGNYSKIKVSPEKVSVSKNEVDAMIERFLVQVGATKKVDRAAKSGDFCEVDFAGKDENGAVIPNTDGKNHRFQIGAGQFLPDLEKAFEKMRAGESKKAVPVRFPKDYHSADFAGRTVKFDVKLHSVEEVSAKNLDSEAIKKITGKSQSEADFRAGIEKMILQEKSQAAQSKAIREYEEKFAKIVEVDLPESWIEKEVEMRMKQVAEHPNFRHDPESFWKNLGKSEDSLKKEFRRDAEMNLRVFLGLSEVVKTEGVKLSEDEITHGKAVATRRAEEGSGADFESEWQKTELNLKIDKFLRCRTIEEE